MKKFSEEIKLHYNEVVVEILDPDDWTIIGVFTESGVDKQIKRYIENIGNGIIVDDLEFEKNDDGVISVKTIHHWKEGTGEKYSITIACFVVYTLNEEFVTPKEK